MGFSFLFLERRKKMNKPNFKHTFNSIKRSASKRSPEILTGLGIAGMLTTTVLAVKATPKAIKLKELEENEKQDYLTKTELVKATWKCYIPAAVTCTVSVACIVGASSIHNKRGAALTAAYKLSETAMLEYKNKVIETIGEKKEKTIRDEVAKDKVKNNPPDKNCIIVTEKGNTLCLEAVSGRYFYSDIDKLKRIENELNKQMLHDISGYISLNDLYDELGLEHTSIGHELGWNAYHLLEFNLSPQLTEDDHPCVVIDYTYPPKYDYYSF